MKGVNSFDRQNLRCTVHCLPAFCAVQSQHTGAGKRYIGKYSAGNSPMCNCWWCDVLLGRPDGNRPTSRNTSHFDPLAAPAFMQDISKNHQQLASSAGNCRFSERKFHWVRQCSHTFWHHSHASHGKRCASGYSQ